MIKTIIIGVGNAQRGDDRAGIAAAEKLLKMRISGIQIYSCGGETSELMELWNGCDKVILIDAMHCGKEVGTVIRIDASSAPVPAEIFSGYSTHNFGLGEAVEMARVLGELPKEVIIYGIEGRNYEVGCKLTKAVSKGVDEVVKRVLNE